MIIKVSKADGVLTAKVLAEQLAVREMLESISRSCAEVPAGRPEVDEIRLPQAGEGSFYERTPVISSKKRGRPRLLPQAPAAGGRNGNRRRWPGRRGQVDYFLRGSGW